MNCCRKATASLLMQYAELLGMTVMAADDATSTIAAEGLWAPTSCRQARVMRYVPRTLTS
jgi:hypothetical protein